MAIAEFGNTVIECLSTDEKPDMPDGWFLKELDSGLCYIRKGGVWTDINLGLSFIKATKSGQITTGTGGAHDVVFNTPFVSADYSVALSCLDTGSDSPALVNFLNITASGFTIQSRSSRSGLGLEGVEVSWLATRNYNP